MTRSPGASRVALLIAVLAVGIAMAFAARGGPETPDQRVERIVAELRCPVCQGLSVADSPSETAREMRGLVEQRVAEGRSDEQIRAEFRASYGDWVFLSPATDSAAALMWLLPVGLVAAGAYIAWRRARAPASRDREPVPAAALAGLRARVAREEAEDL